MAKSPAFQFYPKDWLTDDKVMGMTYAERGIYIDLLCYQWLNEGLNISIVEKPEVTPNVKNCFNLDPDGKYRNPKLERVRAEQQEYRQKQSDKGRKGMESRWGNNTAITQLSSGYNQNDNTAINRLLPDDNSSSSPSSPSSFPTALKDSPPNPHPGEPEKKPERSEAPELIEYWNTFQRVQKHPTITESLVLAVDKELKALKKEKVTLDEIKNAIALYANPKRSFIKKWPLPVFLKQKNACRVFLHGDPWGDPEIDDRDGYIPIEDDPDLAGFIVLTVTEDSGPKHPDDRRYFNADGTPKEKKESTAEIK